MKKRKVTFNMHRGLHRLLKIEAAAAGRDMGSMVQEALDAYLKTMDFKTMAKAGR
jgi:plasmid stability protein